MNEKIEMMPGMGYFQQNKKIYLIGDSIHVSRT